MWRLERGTNRLFRRGQSSLANSAMCSCCSLFPGTASCSWRTRQRQLRLRNRHTAMKLMILSVWQEALKDVVHPCHPPFIRIHLYLVIFTGEHLNSHDSKDEPKNETDQQHVENARNGLDERVNHHLWRSFCTHTDTHTRKGQDIKKTKTKKLLVPVIMKG